VVSATDDLQAARALGVVIKHGALTVREAVAACREGAATPAQQRIVAELVDARMG
jgi:hypothetical protein